jgi:hypothetical protein
VEPIGIQDEPPPHPSDRGVVGIAWSGLFRVGGGSQLNPTTHHPPARPRGVMVPAAPRHDVGAGGPNRWIRDPLTNQLDDVRRLDPRHGALPGWTW